MIYMGLDIGSTAVKAMAVDDNGCVLARGSAAYPTHRDGVKVTQNAEDWWRASVEAARQVTSALEHPEYVKAISTSSQGGSVLAVDGDGRPLCEALTWMDSRSTEEAAVLSERFGDEVYRKCGWRTNPFDSSAKLMWLRNNKNEVWKKAARFVTTEEYINNKLTGAFVTDPTGAAMMRFYNINTNSWDGELCEFTGVREDKLPEVVRAGTNLGKILPEAAEEIGVPDNTLIYCGAHDQYCSSIGSGIVTPGDILLATGTAWVIFGITDDLVFNEKHIDPGHHPVGSCCGAMVSLGGLGAAVEDYSAKIGVSLKDIDKVAAERRLKAANLLYCTSPTSKTFVAHREACLSSYCGKTSLHDEYDIALAMMEGAAFDARIAVDEFISAGIIKEAKVTMAGGASKSPLWRSIVSSLMGGVSVTVEHDTPTLGAAMIAAVSDGAFANYNACSEKCVKKLCPAKESDELCGFYEEKYEKFRHWSLDR